MNNNNVQKINRGNFLLLNFVYELMPVKEILKRKKSKCYTENNNRRKVMDG